MDFTQITRKEFIDNNYNGDYCPDIYDLDCTKPNDCNNGRDSGICKSCWTESVKDIEFEDDLESKDTSKTFKVLFQETTVLRFNNGLDDIIGKPIKLLEYRDTNTYIYGLVRIIGDKYIGVEFIDGHEIYHVEELAKLDPTILDYENMEELINVF